MNTALRSSHCLFPRHALEVEKKPHLIKPVYCSRGISHLEFESYITFIEQILRSILPEDLVIGLSTYKDPQALEKKVLALCENLPIISWNDPDRAPCTLCVSLLCHSDFTHGVGRYFCDALSKWLVPGRFLNISSVRSLKFNFISCPGEPLFFHQVLLDIENDEQLYIARSNKENVEKEARLSILAVRHARHVVSVKMVSSEQKKAMIEEYIASAFSRPVEKLASNVFDQLHNFWLQINAEDKAKKLQEHFSPYVEQHPKIFDRDIFQEIKHSLLLFSDRFTGMRDLRHVSRLISYQYLFRKALMRSCMELPNERHLRLKFLRLYRAQEGFVNFDSARQSQIEAQRSERGSHSKTMTDEKDRFGKVAASQNSQNLTERGISLPSRPNVLGIVGAMNVLRENELFEERHIVEAITHCLPQMRKVENSIVLDRRSHDPIRLFYLEIEKKDGAKFSLEEIKELKKNLPHELKESVENVLHPVLMPRNDEEIMRNIFLLSQQLRYFNDLPQVIISFNAQTEQQLQFTVILLRVLRDEDPSIAEIFSKSGTELKMEDIEVKKVGLLRKRYPKEANVFKVSLDKKQFLRKDYTIDLFKARQAVSLKLNTVFNGIRDFNGGILMKQQEVFQELRNLIKETSFDNDFLLENFFYSITPPLRQTLILPSSLRTLFSLMQEALSADFKKESFFLKAQFEPEQLLTMVASPFPSIKEELFSLMAKLKIPTQDLSCTHVNAYGIACIGYIYQNRDPNIRHLFYSTLLSCLQAWQTRVKK